MSENRTDSLLKLLGVNLAPEHLEKLQVDMESGRLVREAEREAAKDVCQRVTEERRAREYARDPLSCRPVVVTAAVEKRMEASQ